MFWNLKQFLTYLKIKGIKSQSWKRNRLVFVNTEMEQATKTNVSVNEAPVYIVFLQKLPSAPYFCEHRTLNSSLRYKGGWANFHILKADKLNRSGKIDTKELVNPLNLSNFLCRQYRLHTAETTKVLILEIPAVTLRVATFCHQGMAQQYCPPL